MPIGIGDDCASLQLTPGRNCLITTDTLLEGVHFDRKNTSARQIGRKALAVNLSDMAAMAGIPLAAVVTFGLPRDFGQRLAEELYLGLKEIADQFHVAIVGGDTNFSPAGLVVSVTLLGEDTARGPVRRSGALPGDWIMATGSFGGSILGRHLEFSPRVGEARQLHQRYDLHAMIDVSDGLAADLFHILEESHTGAVLEQQAIPISDAAYQMADDRSALKHALGDGEDFELLIVLAPEEGKRLLEDQPLDEPLSHIGYITEGGGNLLIESPDGSRDALEPLGYDHFRE